jgi:hypothetical protein
MRYKVLVVSAVLALASVAWGQYYPRARRMGGTVNPAPPGSGLPNPTMEGTLRMMTNKQITLQMQTEDQIVNIRRDRKTKFFENGKEVKPSEIAIGTPLAIDVKEDIDLKPLAVRVVVNPSPPKADQTQSPKLIQRP